MKIVNHLAVPIVSVLVIALGAQQPATSWPTTSWTRATFAAFLDALVAPAGG